MANRQFLQLPRYVSFGQLTGKFKLNKESVNYERAATGRAVTVELLC